MLTSRNNANFFKHIGGGEQLWIAVHLQGLLDSKRS